MLSPFRVLLESIQVFAKVANMLFGTFDRPVLINDSLKFFFAWEYGNAFRGLVAAGRALENATKFGLGTTIEL
jgi:hypothetical protein